MKGWEIFVIVLFVLLIVGAAIGLGWYFYHKSRPTPNPSGSLFTPGTSYNISIAGTVLGYTSNVCDNNVATYAGTSVPWKFTYNTDGSYTLTAVTKDATCIYINLNYNTTNNFFLDNSSLPITIKQITPNTYTFQSNGQYIVPDGSGKLALSNIASYWNITTS